jgi:hypothetical protein
MIADFYGLDRSNDAAAYDPGTAAVTIVLWNNA